MSIISEDIYNSLTQPQKNKDEKDILIPNDIGKALLAPIPTSKSTIQVTDDMSLKPIRSAGSLRPINETLLDLENDPEYVRVAERFLESIGETDIDPEDMFEYLRDSDYSLTSFPGGDSALSIALASKNWSDRQKKDYAYLSQRFDKAGLKGSGMEHYVRAIADIGGDLVSDPTMMLAILAGFITGGGSIGARFAAGKAATEGLKKLTNHQQAMRFGKVEAGIGFVWGAGHDAALQNVDINVGLQNSGFDLGQTALFGGFAALLGGGIGYGVSRFLTRSNLTRSVIARFSDEDRIIRSSNNLEVSELERIRRKAEWEGIDSDLKLEGRNLDLFDTPVRISMEGVEDADFEEQVINKNLFGRIFESISPKFTANYGDWLMAHTQGKPTTQLREYGLRSETMFQLLNDVREDWDKPLTKWSKYESLAGRYRPFSFHETLHQQRSKYVAEMQFPIDGMKQVGWSKARNDRIRLWLEGGPNAPELTGEDLLGATAIRQALNNHFKDAINAGIAKRTSWRENYFPHMYNKRYLKDNRTEFEDILIEFGYADISPTPAQVERYMRNATEEVIDISTGRVQKAKRNLNYDEAQRELQEIFDAKTIDDFDITAPFATERDKARHIVDNMLTKDQMFFDDGIERTKKGVGNLNPRVFNKIPYERKAAFLEEDITEVLLNYSNNLAHSMARTKHPTLRGNKEFFKNQILPKIKQELDDKDFPLKAADEQALMQLYDYVLGIDMPTMETWTGSKVMQGTSDWLRLSQQTAHLPLATVSSVTEAFIPFIRVPINQWGKGMKDMGEAIGYGINDIGRKSYNAGRAAFLERLGLSEEQGKRLLIPDSPLERLWYQERHAVGLAHEMNVFERIQGLSGGERMQSKLAQKLQRGFFNANILSPWTHSVEGGAYTLGKTIIKDNLQTLYKIKNGLKTKYDDIPEIKLDRLQSRITEELHDLGIPIQEGLAWIERGSPQVFKQESGVEQLDTFFENYFSRGAARFSRGIILNPSAVSANKPMIFSHPAGQMLFQFLGYPTAFNNTILREGIYQLTKNPSQNLPKLAAVGTIMTGVAGLTNYLRNPYDYEGEGDPNRPEFVSKEAWVTMKAVQRWGGLGPMDFALRGYENAQVGGGGLAIFLKTPTGPLMQDFVDTIQYRKGIPELAVTNMPGYSALPVDTRTDLRRWARGTKKEAEDPIFPDVIISEEQARGRFKRGGEVDIRNAKTEPEDRKIPGAGGVSFSDVAGFIVQDTDDRQRFAFGRLVKPIIQSLFKKETDLDLLINSIDKDPDLDRLIGNKLSTDIIQPRSTMKLLGTEDTQSFLNSSVVKHPVSYISRSDLQHSISDALDRSTNIGIHTGDRIFAEGMWLNDSNARAFPSLKSWTDFANDKYSLQNPEFFESIIQNYMRKHKVDYDQALAKIREIYKQQTAINDNNFVNSSELLFRARMIDRYDPESPYFTGQVLKKRDTKPEFIIGMPTVKGVQKAIIDMEELINPEAKVKRLNKFLEKLETRRSKILPKIRANYKKLRKDNPELNTITLRSLMRKEDKDYNRWLGFNDSIANVKNSIKEAKIQKSGYVTAYSDLKTKDTKYLLDPKYHAEIDKGPVITSKPIGFRVVFKPDRYNQQMEKYFDMDDQKGLTNFIKRHENEIEITEEIKADLGLFPRETSAPEGQAAKLEDLAEEYKPHDYRQDTDLGSEEFPVSAVTGVEGEAVEMGPGMKIVTEEDLRTSGPMMEVEAELKALKMDRDIKEGMEESLLPARRIISNFERLRKILQDEAKGNFERLANINARLGRSTEDLIHKETGVSFESLQNYLQVNGLDVPQTTRIDGYIRMINPLKLEKDLHPWGPQEVLDAFINDETVSKSLLTQAKVSDKEIRSILKQAIAENQVYDDIIDAFIKNPKNKDLPQDSETALYTLSRNLQSRNIVNLLEMMGFDGIQYKIQHAPRLAGKEKEKGYAYIIFDPTQFAASTNESQLVNKPLTRKKFMIGGLVSKGFRETIKQSGLKSEISKRSFLRTVDELEKIRKEHDTIIEGPQRDLLETARLFKLEERIGMLENSELAKSFDFGTSNSILLKEAQDQVENITNLKRAKHLKVVVDNPTLNPANINKVQEAYGDAIYNKALDYLTHYQNRVKAVRQAFEKEDRKYVGVQYMNPNPYATAKERVPRSIDSSKPAYINYKVRKQHPEVLAFHELFHYVNENNLNAKKFLASDMVKAYRFRNNDTRRDTEVLADLTASRILEGYNGILEWNDRINKAFQAQIDMLYRLPYEDNIKYLDSYVGDIDDLIEELIRYYIPAEYAPISWRGLRDIKRLPTPTPADLAKMSRKLSQNLGQPFHVIAGLDVDITPRTKKYGGGLIGGRKKYATGSYIAPTRGLVKMIRGMHNKKPYTNQDLIDNWQALKDKDKTELYEKVKSLPTAKRKDLEELRKNYFNLRINMNKVQTILYERKNPWESRKKSFNKKITKEARKFLLEEEERMEKIASQIDRILSPLVSRKDFKMTLFNTHPLPDKALKYLKQTYNLDNIVTEADLFKEAGDDILRDYYSNFIRKGRALSKLSFIDIVDEFELLLPHYSVGIKAYDKKGPL